MRSPRPFSLLLMAVLASTGWLASGCSADDTAEVNTTTAALLRPRRPPPNASCRNVCEARHIECGYVKSGRGVYDCGDCANDDICKQGRCVPKQTCKPSNRYVNYCSG